MKEISQEEKLTKKKHKLIDDLDKIRRIRERKVKQLRETSEQLEELVAKRKIKETVDVRTNFFLEPIPH